MIKMAWFFPLLMSSEYAACAIAKTCGPPFVKFVLYDCIVLVSYDPTIWKGFTASRMFLMYVYTPGHSFTHAAGKQASRQAQDQHHIGPRTSTDKGHQERRKKKEGN